MSVDNAEGILMLQALILFIGQTLSFNRIACDCWNCEDTVIAHFEILKCIEFILIDEKMDYNIQIEPIEGRKPIN